MSAVEIILFVVVGIASFWLGKLLVRALRRLLRH